LKPFLRIGQIQNPKEEFSETIDFLKQNIGKIEGFTLGGIHRWSPEAFSFEFHNDLLSDILLEKRWENVYALPLLKVGVYLGDDTTVCINTRQPETFLELIGEEIDGNQLAKADQIFQDFKGKVIDFFSGISNDIGEMTLIHRSEGFDMDDTRMSYLKRLRKTRDIFKTNIEGDPHAAVEAYAKKVTTSFDELEGWKIIDVRDYSFAKGVENLILIEFCTPQYAGQAMRMNRTYNLALPCLGSVRSESGRVFINMFLPTYMFRPLFYSVDKKTRDENADFPKTVTRIIRETSLKKV